MAKDPAFLYYDGDAARDVSHMNRLERGCYFDIIQAQRKFGRMSIDVIKKILGKDFDTCWESVKICLRYENDMYFIEWVEDSANKRKAYSESRKCNRMGQKKEDMSIISKRYVEDMENENENVIDNVFKEDVFKKEEAQVEIISGGDFTFPPAPYDQPSLEKVKFYFEQAGYPIAEAEKFWSYYDGMGWETSRGQPIRTWTSKVMGWMKNKEQFNRENKTNGSSPNYRNAESGKKFKVIGSD